MKKLWDNPELTVLVKRKSDEVILASCKEYGGDANVANSGCHGVNVKLHCTGHCK
jgi:hypothetical protein